MNLTEYRPHILHQIAKQLDSRDDLKNIIISSETYRKFINPTIIEELQEIFRDNPIENFLNQAGDLYNYLSHIKDCKMAKCRNFIGQSVIEILKKNFFIRITPSWDGTVEKIIIVSLYEEMVIDSCPNIAHHTIYQIVDSKNPLESAKKISNCGYLLTKKDINGKVIKTSLISNLQ